jgi:hypothetical protein
VLRPSHGILCSLVVAAVVLVPTASADVHYGTAYKWKVTSVGGTYRTHGGWSFCAEARGPATVGCSRGFTVSNGVSGTINVSDGVISSAVGFNVTTATTITGSASYRVARRVEGVIDWRPVYDTRKVRQERYVCTTVNGSCPTSSSWHPDRRYATAYARKYIGPGFKYVP